MQHPLFVGFETDGIDEPVVVLTETRRPRVSWDLPEEKETDIAVLHTRRRPVIRRPRTVAHMSSSKPLAGVSKASDAPPGTPLAMAAGLIQAKLQYARVTPFTTDTMTRLAAAPLPAQFPQPLPELNTAWSTLTDDGNKPPPKPKAFKARGKAKLMEESSSSLPRVTVY